MKKYIILFVSILLLFLVGVPSTFAQKNNERPGWTMNPPKAGNGTYSYIVEFATGTTDESARNTAIAKVFQTMIMRLGMPVNASEINQALQSGKSYGEISMQYSIPVNKVCEYVEKISDGYRVYVLCQVAKSGRVSPDFDHFTGCNDIKRYKNWVAGIESTFIPGLGQMTKRRFGAGSAFLVTELALAGGAVTTKFIAKEKLEILKDPNISFGNFTNTTKSYNNMRLINNVCLGAVAAVHLFNIVHAVVAKPNYKENNYSFYPTVIQSPNENNMAFGMGCTISF